MPKRTDIKSILLIGSGPIIIGQACEFDYSGTQALKALKEEGYRVILVNSNPATIMTDPDFADRTYIEPISTEIVEKIIQKERPDVLLPTLGGQTALNLAIELAERGILGRYGVEMIGAKLESIKKAEDRDLFKQAMRRAGLDLPRSGYARNLREAVQIQRRLHHRGSSADPDRQGISDHARCRASGHSRDRRRYRRFQYPVCGESQRRAHGGDRDESAGLAQLGVGQQGHRVSDCQDRGQAGRGLHAGRDSQ